MFVRYKGGREYVCNSQHIQPGLPACQSIRAAPIDAAVGRAFLAAVAPAELDALARAEMPDDEIAETLTREGHRSPTCPDRVLPVTVQGVRLAAGVKAKAQRTRWRHPRGVLGVTAMAERMGIPSKWLYVQIRSGRILIDRQPSGAYLFEDAPEVVTALHRLRNHAVERVDLRAHQPAQEGHRHG